MKHGEAAVAYGAYLNASLDLDRRFDDDHERDLFVADLEKSKCEMERAWLEAFRTV